MPAIEPHGTPDYLELAELGLSPEDLVYFSSNINPYGPPDEVVDALQAAMTRDRIALYPDRFSTALAADAAAIHNVAPAAILVGNGTADIMWLLALTFREAAKIVIVGPTFSEYENVATLTGARRTIVAHPGWEVAGETFRPGERDLDAVAAEIRAATPDLVFLCNPNNPTGRNLGPEDVLTLHQAAPDAVWVVDEAYAEFAPEPWSAVRWIDRGNWIVLRSMTKDFSLGGLRLGYLVTAPARVAHMQTLQPPWNVNGFAQLAGRAALACLEWRRETLARLREHVDEMRAALVEHGFAPLPTAANYFLLPVNRTATAVRADLLAQGLVVRDCTSFGLPHHIRIAAQRPEENARLVAALAGMET